MGVDVYLTVVFWLGIVRMISHAILLVAADYPRVVKRSLGMDIVSFMVAIFFFAWVVYLRDFQ